MTTRSESAPEIDYARLFDALPAPCLVLDRDLVIRAVNRAHEKATSRTREELIGRSVFAAYPGNPNDPGATGLSHLRASLERVLATGRTDSMAVLKYDVPSPGRPGEFVERWWSPANVPVLDERGEVAWILNRAENLTGFARAHGAGEGPPEPPEGPAAELYQRAQDLERLNAELREANARERQVAVTLQRAMLYSPDLPRHEGIAVRYRPATGTLNVCGDWYDVTDLDSGRYAAAVGDVVGHGLEAAAVMGMLRSALSAAMRATAAPGQALGILGLYAESVEGALAATAVKVLIDPGARRIAYSSAGHLPPVLLRPDGRTHLLEGATDPPLAARIEGGPRAEAVQPYQPGDTLILYTDGLVERRGESIDTGLDRLAHALTDCGPMAPDVLADTVLTRLGVGEGTTDDVALVVIRL
ncbi:SpoIIE family protein phosphatase [Streptomyces sp. DSM 44917]|uniref:SpoIIE family protein phosphatase n=1 Tax=Streptomyces boetiae TaxID=3075541 RepID=A0ABU2L5R9_9ACTN|nr:SpoIIE family protein phosphatase [Streptomyces sp. DSM 44917]MDT0306901.1 SpoIIE family protein phosphatase [Streptomyces sp. DSM 44917]